MTKHDHDAACAGEAPFAPEHLRLWNELTDMILEWEDSTETAGDLARRIIRKVDAVE